MTVSIMTRSSRRSERGAVPVSTERSFGLWVGGLCGAAAAFRVAGGYRDSGTTLAVVGVILVVAGLVAPAALRIPNRLWWRFGQTLAWINARVLLTAVFFAVLTPMGYLMRAIGRNPLRAMQTGTNWRPYVDRRRDPRHYERMF